MSSDSSRDRLDGDERDVDDREATEVGEAPEVDTDGAAAGGADSTVADDATTAEGSDAADPEAADPDDADQRGSGLLPKRLLLGSAALALASFIVAAVFGVLWLVTSTGDRAELASARGSVSDRAREAVQAFTELDAAHPDRYFSRAKAVSTEEFAKQIEKTEQSARKALAQAKTKVSTIVQDVAVQELNNHEGTATFLAVVKTNVTQGEKQSSKVLRLRGEMERVSTADGEAWKLANLGGVPVVGNSGATGQNQGQGSGSNAGAGQSNGGK